MIDDAIPQGWTSGLYGFRPDLIVVERPRDAQGFAGAVTIDFKRRVFASGVDPYGNFPSGWAGRDYKGRGWRLKLVTDACEWLEGVMSK